MAARRGLLGAGLAGLLLIVLALAALGAARLSAGLEAHAYSVNPLPPETVQLTAGRTYLLSYPGGVKALATRGMTPSALQCIWSPASRPPAPLPLVTEPTDSQWRNVVASFVAPATGRVGISCVNLGAMFVDDADDASPDVAGWLVLVALLALTAGAPLCIAALHARIGW